MVAGYPVKMKVIMLKDVSGVGQRGDVHDVSDGYALNFLIPRGAAEQATPEKLKAHSAQLAAASAAEIARETEWAKVARALEGIVVTVPAKANSLGHLYTRLSPDLISLGLHEKLGIEIPSEAILMNTPIKEVGDTSVVVRFGKHSAHITVNVIAQA